MEIIMNNFIDIFVEKWMNERMGTEIEENSEEWKDPKNDDWISTFLEYK